MAWMILFSANWGAHSFGILIIMFEKPQLRSGDHDERAVSAYVCFLQKTKTPIPKTTTFFPCSANRFFSRQIRQKTPCPGVFRQKVVIDIVFVDEGEDAREFPGDE